MRSTGKLIAVLLLPACAEPAAGEMDPGLDTSGEGQPRRGVRPAMGLTLLRRAPLVMSETATEGQQGRRPKAVTPRTADQAARRALSVSNPGGRIRSNRACLGSMRATSTAMARRMLSSWDRSVRCSCAGEPAIFKLPRQS